MRYVYRAWTLHPRLAIDLHGESFGRYDSHAATLCESSTGITKTRFHLAHVQTVFQTYNLDQIVPDILNRGRQIDGIKATGTEFLVGTFLSFAESMPRVMFTPKVRTSVSERNVQ